MEENPTASTTPTTPTNSSSKMTQELSAEGLKYLEETIEAALCNGDSSSDGGHHCEMGGIGGSGDGALDEACLRYKNSVTSLLTVLTAIPNSIKMKQILRSWKSKRRI